MKRASLAVMLLIWASLAHAATRYGLEVGAHSGSVSISDDILQSPRDEGRRELSFGLGPVVDWTLPHGWGASASLRYDELHYGSHEFALGVVGDPSALWTDRTLRFRQLTFAPGVSLRVLSGLRLQVTPELGVLLTARQADELVPGPMPGFVVPAIRFATAGTIFEQVGTRLDRDVTGDYERVQAGVAGALSYEQPLGAHALRVALGAHTYTANGPKDDRSYWDWRTSLTWLN